MKNGHGFVLLVSLLLSVFTACQSGDDSESKEQGGDIVLIFQEPKVEAKSGRIGAPFFIDQAKIEYWGQDEIPRMYVADSSASFDTLILSTTHPQLEVVHFFRTYDRFTYRFQAGDTVLFTYPESRPFAQLLNREVSDTTLNYDAIWRDQITQPFPAHRKNIIEEVITQLDAGLDLKTLLEKEGEIQAGIQLAAQQEVNAELMYLDSLRKEEILTEDEYQYRSLNARLALKKKEVEIALQAFKGIASDQEIETEHVKIEAEVDGVNVALIENVLGEEADELIANSAYRELLEIYFYFFGRKVNWISEEVSYNGKPGGGFRHPDYTQKYDSISASPLLTDEVQKYFLRKELENIIEHMSLADKETYLNKFEERFADSASIAYLQEKFSFGLIDTEGENDLMLSSYEGKELSYQELLTKHAGKVVYVDFWSTSCRPCLTEMPASDSLKAELEREEIVFVHISLEPNQDSWKRGCDKFSLEKESYLIQNKFTSAEFEKMGIDWIPHYLIYDRNGVLVEPHAPRPSEERSADVLRTYL